MATLILYLVLVAATMALLEIQIEGGAGWAKNLPTWRINGTIWNKLLGRAEITGYHLCLNLFLLVLFHLPFVMLGQWNWGLEARAFGSLFCLFVIEDFLWFVFNPRFSLARFFKKDVPWHKFWIGPFPAFYYSGLIIGGLLIYWSYYGF